MTSFGAKMTLEQAKILTKYRERKQRNKQWKIWIILLLAFVWLFSCFVAGYSDAYLNKNKHNKEEKTNDRIQHKAKTKTYA